MSDMPSSALSSQKTLLPFVSNSEWCTCEDEPTLSLRHLARKDTDRPFAQAISLTACLAIV